MLITHFTIAFGEEDLCTDILYQSQEQAVSAAVENDVSAFKFEWDGVDAQTMTSIEKITE